MGVQYSLYLTLLYIDYLIRNEKTLNTQNSFADRLLIHEY